MVAHHKQQFNSMMPVEPGLEKLTRVSFQQIRSMEEKTRKKPDFSSLDRKYDLLSS